MPAALASPTLAAPRHAPRARRASVVAAAEADHAPSRRAALAAGVAAAVLAVAAPR
jgi:hypothetical protein